MFLWSLFTPAISEKIIQNQLQEKWQKGASHNIGGIFRFYHYWLPVHVLESQHFFLQPPSSSCLIYPLMSQSDADDFRWKSFVIQTSKEARKRPIAWKRMPGCLLPSGIAFWLQENRKNVPVTLMCTLHLFYNLPWKWKGKCIEMAVSICSGPTSRRPIIPCSNTVTQRLGLWCFPC